MWCENSTLSDVKLRLIYLSFGERVYRLLQRHRCRRGTCRGRFQYADMELLSLLRFRICDFFRSSCFYIAFWHIVYHKPRFFAPEPFIGVCREIDCELTHTVNSAGDLSFERFWFFDAESCRFCVFFCAIKVDFSVFCSFWSLSFLGFRFYRNFDGIVFFCKSCHWNLSVLRTEFLGVL